MFRAKSSHKRKRSSARADVSRKFGPSRWNVQLLPHISRAAEKAPDIRLSYIIDEHPFNQTLDLILPLPDNEDDEMPTSVAVLVKTLQSAAKAHRSYRAVVPLSLFLDPIFVTAYLRTGSLTALSCNADQHAPEHQEDDQICLDGQGTLVLSLCKDTYQTLGLTGRPSHFSRMSSGRAADRTSGPSTRFIVELPLLSPSFIPGKKAYQQAQRRLNAWDRARAQARDSTHSIPSTHLTGKIASTASTSTQLDSSHATWDMLFVWSPPPETLSGMTEPECLDTSIKFPAELVDASNVRLLSLHQHGPVVTDSVWVPPLSSPAHPLSRPWSEPARNFAELEPKTSQSSWSGFQFALQEAVEWAGLVALDSTAVRTYIRTDNNCVYSPPAGSQPGKVLRLHWSGGQTPLLLSPSFVSFVTAQIDQHCRSSSYWAALSCSGFAHAPLTWRAKVPLSRRFGLQPPSKQIPAVDAMSEVSSDDDEDNDAAADMTIDSSNDSDTQKKRKPRKKSKRLVGKNQTEHAFSPSTGETGWVSFCLPPPAPKPEKEVFNTNWLLVELIGTDTRS